MDVTITRAAKAHGVQTSMTLVNRAVRPVAITDVVEGTMASVAKQRTQDLPATAIILVAALPETVVVFVVSAMVCSAVTAVTRQGEATATPIISIVASVQVVKVFVTTPSVLRDQHGLRYRQVRGDAHLPHRARHSNA